MNGLEDCWNIGQLRENSPNLNDFKQSENCLLIRKKYVEKYSKIYTDGMFRSM